MASESPKGSRCKKRWLSRVAAWQLTEWLVALLTYYELGCPKFTTQLVNALGSWQVSTRQNIAILELFEGTIPFCRAQPSEDWSRGRKTLYDTISSFYSNDVVVGDVSSCNNVAARQVRNEHISLPSTAGILDPCTALCPERQRVLKDMRQIIKPEEQWPDPLPRPCFMVDPAEEQGLRVRLVGCGLASLLAENEVPTDSYGRKLLAGVFAVPHKSDSDRLIFDRRLQNATEHRLQWCTLPHGSQLTQIRLEANEHVRGSGDDLSNYFYLLSHQPNWRSRSAFGRVFAGAEAAALGGDPGARYHLCLNIVAMGDLNSVDVAQATHEGVLTASGCLAAAEKLEYGNPVPRSSVWEGVYVDDHLVVGIVPKHKVAEESGPDYDLILRSREGYKSWELPTSDKKSYTLQKKFVAWGTEVDSDKGTAAAPLDRRIQLFYLTLLVLSGPGITLKMFQSLLGSYVHPFSHRKELMCVFSRSYRWLQTLSVGRVYKVPHDIRDELLGAALVLPCAHADLRASLSSTLTCSDATQVGGGVTSVEVAGECAEGLFRHGEHRGAYTRLDWGPDDWQLKPWTGHQLPEVLVDVIRGASWKVDRSFLFSQSDHVNVQEARALKSALVQHCLRSSAPEVCINGTDSRVCLGAFGKGRSSAPKLNNVLRQCLGLHLLCRKRLVQFWMASALNPADDPSRFVVLRQPQAVGSEASRLLRVGRTPSNKSVRGSHALCMLALEIFSGIGALSAALESSGFGVSAPMDAYPAKNVYVPEHDLLMPSVVKQLEALFAAGCYFYVHFGLPCSSFSRLQHWNGGTRTLAHPEGDCSLEREIIGNKLARITARLCLILHKAGCYFSIENPRFSYVWNFPPILKLLDVAFDVDFDQCMYGLRPPHIPQASHSTFHRKPTPLSSVSSKLHSKPTQNTFIKKPSRVRTNLSSLNGLSRVCSKDHEHFHCCGSVKTSNGWVSVAKAAGHYPLGLCETWANLVKHAAASKGRQCT